MDWYFDFISFHYSIEKRAHADHFSLFSDSKSYLVNQTPLIIALAQVIMPGNTRCSTEWTLRTNKAGLGMLLIMWFCHQIITGIVQTWFYHKFTIKQSSYSTYQPTLERLMVNATTSRPIRTSLFSRINNIPTTWSNKTIWTNPKQQWSKGQRAAYAFVFIYLPCCNLNGISTRRLHYRVTSLFRHTAPCIR